MKIVIKKLNFNELIAIISFIVFLVSSLLSTSFYYQYFIDFHKYIIVSSVSLLFIKEFSSKYDFRKLFSILIIIVILSITILKSSGINQLLFPISFIYIYYLKDLSFEKISKITFIISLTTLIFIILSSKLGIITDYIVSDTIRTRHFLGFRYALFPSTIMTNITLLFVYFKKNAIKYYQLVLLFFINYWIFNQTNSRLTFYTSILILIFSLFLKIFPNFSGKIGKLSVFLIPSFIISFFTSFLLSYNYNAIVEWQFNLNSFLGQRLILGYNSLNRYGFSLFGKRVSWVGNGLDAFGNTQTDPYSYVDSLYIQILQRYGIIVTFLFILLLTVLLYILYQKKEYYLIVIFSIIAVHGIIDDLVLMLHYNTFWLLLGALINKNYEVNDGDYSFIALKKGSEVL
ncbi:hypothetical protein [Streptococcus marimammalium]|uniref:hypothetical protein n=1 Tax=Streptococcus marimammalium TaxID=269666 RepID=UPI00037783C5|nr:hypothetical protein [Streptococcus marimammalium]